MADNNLLREETGRSIWMEKGKSVLVTGGAGFIGSHVVDKLLAQGSKVVVLDDLSTGKLCNLPVGHESLRFVEGSVLDRSAVAEAARNCDAIVHLAAVASVQASIADPQRTHQVNFGGTLMLLEEAKAAGIRHFLFSSTAAVYGASDVGPISEEERVSPLTPYAIDKLASEYYIKHFHRTYGINFTIFRFFNVFGPRQDPGSPYSGVISIFCERCNAGKSLTIFGDGEQTRDFIYVGDLSQVIIDSILNEVVSCQTINVGTGMSVSLNELVRVLGVIYDRDVEIVYKAARSGDIRHSLANVALLRSLYPELPETPMLEGLRMTVAALESALQD